MTWLLVILLFLQIASNVFSTLTTTYPSSLDSTQTQHTIFEPQQLRPLTNVEITSNFPASTLPLSTFSTTISLLSTLNPNQLDPQDLTPFGESLSLQFTHDQLDYAFTLTLDPHSVISHDDLYPTFATAQNGENLSYPKKSTYRGTMLSESGEDLLIVTVLPINFDMSEYAQIKPRLDTQSINEVFTTLSTTLQTLFTHFQTLSMDSTSGRQLDGYTIMGTLYKHDGDIYQIDSATSLLSNQLKALTSYTSQLGTHSTNLQSIQSMMEARGEIDDDGQTQTTLNVTEINDEMQVLSAHISTLSNSILSIQDVQLEASYDLAMYKLDTHISELSQCRTESRSQTDSLIHNPTHDESTRQESNQLDDSNDQSTTSLPSPLDSRPLWTFERWSNCHRRINGTTIFNQRVFVSASYSSWVSNTQMPDRSRVVARIAHLYTLINLPSFQQLGIYWRVSSIEIRTEATDEKWNVLDTADPRCKPSASTQLLLDLASLREEDVSGIEQQNSISHLFYHCSPAGTFTSGMAFTGQGCSKNFAVAWSLLVDPSNYITTSHESTGHSLLNLEHPFGENPALKGSMFLFRYLPQSLLSEIPLSHILSSFPSFVRIPFSFLFSQNQPLLQFAPQPRETQHKYFTHDNPTAFGGIMDYTNQHLPTTIAEATARGKIGFNRNTDESTACLRLENLMKYAESENMVERRFCYAFVEFIGPDKDQFTVEYPEPVDVEKDSAPPRPDNSSSKSDSRLTNNIYEYSPTCGNGVVEPYEECDVDTVCCKNCRFIPNATCDGTNPHCCENCGIVASNLKRCPVNSLKAGFCFRGTCLQLFCHPDRSFEVIDICPDLMYFNQHPQSPCVYTCPTIQGDAQTATPDIDQCVLNITANKFQWFVDGAHCITPDTKELGLCMQNGPFDSGLMPACKPMSSFTSPPQLPNSTVPDSTLQTDQTESPYSWYFSALNTCDCPTTSTLVGLYTCRDPSGHAVAQSFCDGLTKPLVPSCACETIITWQYTSWNTTCGFTECHIGLYSRQSWCEKTNMDGSVSRTDNISCETIHGKAHIYRECLVPPTSPLQCQVNEVCAPNPNTFTPYRICVEGNENDGSDSTTVFIISVLLVVGFAVAGIIGIVCVLKKCHFPPFHGRNRPNPDTNNIPLDEQTPLEHETSFQRTSTLVMKNSPSDAYQRLE